ncbi:uncharacterized protein LOC144166716 [Haemaphysalis longicornis]
MAHGRHEFALVGYSEDLERKPLKFVGPIPAARICSACSNVPRLTYYLLCGHTLCEPCYECCVTTSECVCPLDGDVCATADVSSKEYPVGNLLKRPVHCWNEANGCGVVLPASQIAEHVRHECQHHVTRCPTCLATVLSRHVCAHLKSGCSSLVLHAAPAAQQETANNDNAHFVALEREVKESVRELDARLAQLSLENASHSDKLVQFCHNLNHLSETLKTELTRASIRSIDRLNRNEAEVKELAAHVKTIEQRAGDLDTKLSQLSLKSDTLSDKLLDKITEIKVLYTEKNESLRTTITSALAPVPSGTKTHQRILTGYAALKEKALKDGWSWSMSEKVYLRRYLLSWGILLLKEGDIVYVRLCIQLHEGEEDGLLDWPFTKQFTLSIIHPETRQERLLRGEGCSSESTKDSFARPIKTSNRATRIDTSRVKTSDIESHGYVKGDELLLRFEVL